MAGHPDFLFELGRCVLTNYTDNDQLPEIPFDTVDLMFRNCRLSTLPKLNVDLQILRFDNCNREMITIPLVLPRLCQLSIWNCQDIVEFPQNINGVNNLTIISVENCPNLIITNPSVFDKINILFLKNTGITHLPSIKVKTLMLYQNSLRQIDYLPNIETINVSSNDYEHIRSIVDNRNVNSVNVNDRYN